jgi:protein TonB
MKMKNCMYAILLMLPLSSFSTKSRASVNHSAAFQNDTIPAQFPGGATGWRKFLEKKMNRDLPVENGAPAGTYVAAVSFLVDTNGNISNIQLLKNPGYGTGEEVIRLMKISPKWVPATKNGQNINSRQTQSITYEIAFE